eukprot:12408508-Karenia_brevis.AAC.1
MLASMRSNSKTLASACTSLMPYSAHTEAERKIAGCNARELKDAGFKEQELRVAGFNAHEIM